MYKPRLTRRTPRANDARVTQTAHEHVPTREGYDRWAEVYDGEGNPLIALEEPLVARLIGDARGLDSADIGCGTGRHALRLAAAGARVTAIDFSEGMLARARAKPGADLVTWRSADVGAPLPLADASFDLVLCALVLDHIADPGTLFKELRRIARPGRPIVVSSMHPAMMLRGVQARFTDPATGREVRPASSPNQLSDYVNGALHAGLAIDHFSEHACDEALAARVPRAAKHIGWPMLVVMRLIA